MTAAPTAFGLLDWAIVALYAVGVTAVGVALVRRQKDTNEYFRGGRSVPAWAAAISIVATSVSAVTFLGGPSDAYSGNLTYLSVAIGQALAIAIVAKWFIPAFFRADVTTVYGLLGLRCGPGARTSASAAFLMGRLLASGARLFAGAIPVALVVFGRADSSALLMSIALIAGVATIYTLLGGVEAVVWTEAPQALLFIGTAIVAIGLLLARIPLGPGEIAGALEGTGKLTVLDFRADPALPFSFWSVIIGFTLFNLAVYGTDQDLAQRMLTCRSAAAGAASAIMSLFIGLLVAALFLIVGALLYVYYQRPDLMGDAAPAYDPGEARDIFLTFILAETPTGVRGLMVAGVLAAAMSSLASSLTSMSSALVMDFYRPLRPGRTERHYVRTSRVGVLVCALALSVFAVICAAWQERTQQGLLPFAIGVMIFAYAGLLGVFLTAIFTRRGNGVSATLALIAGCGAVLLSQNLRWIGVEGVRLSIGWWMTIGTTVSFAVCALGRRPAPRDAA